MAARSRFEFIITARDRTRRAFRGIRRAFGRLRLGLAGIVGGVGFGALTKQALEFATSIEAASRRVGVAGDTLEALKIAAQDDGVAFTNLVTIMQRLSRRAGDAVKGNSDLAQSFLELGVGFDTLLRGDAEEIFFQVAEGAKEFNGTLGELQSTLQKVGDTETVSAAGFLRRGEGEIRARIAELRREGAILGEESRKSIAEQERKGRQDLIALQQEFNDVLRDLLPVMREILPLVREAAKIARETVGRREEITARASSAIENTAGAVGFNPFVSEREIAAKLDRIAGNTAETASRIEQAGVIR